jgi:hypothetical protein
MAFGADLIGSKYDRALSFAFLGHFWANGRNFLIARSSNLQLDENMRTEELCLNAQMDRRARRGMAERNAPGCKRHRRLAHRYGNQSNRSECPDGSGAGP